MDVRRAPSFRRAISLSFSQIDRTENLFILLESTLLRTDKVAIVIKTMSFQQEKRQIYAIGFKKPMIYLISSFATDL